MILEFLQSKESERWRRKYENEKEKVRLVMELVDELTFREKNTRYENEDLKRELLSALSENRRLRRKHHFADVRK